MTIIRPTDGRLRAELLPWREAGSGALANFMVFLSVKINTTDQAGRVVRVEMTEHQACELGHV